MKAISLLYHDVIPAGQFDSSGFPGGDSNIYKLDVDQFRLHLDAIAQSNPHALFTFEPTIACDAVDDCVVAGRFTIQRSTSARTAAALARGSAIHVLQQSVYWNAKKVVKLAGGSAWLKFRKRVLSDEPTRTL